MVTETPSRVRGLLDRVAGLVQSLFPPSPFPGSSVERSNGNLRPESFTSMSDGLDVDGMYYGTDSDMESQAGSYEDLGFIKRVVPLNKHNGKEKEHQDTNSEMKHRTESSKDSPRLLFFVGDDGTGAHEEDHQDTDSDVVKYQAEGSSDPIHLGFFKKQDVVTTYEEDHQDVENESLIKTKTHRASKSKNQSQSKGKRAYGVNNDDKRQVKKMKYKMAQVEAGELDDNKGWSDKRVKSESPSVRSKSKNKSQSARKKTTANNDSHGPHKQVRSKPPRRTSTRHQSKSNRSHTENDERDRVSRKVQFKSPVESRKTQSKKPSRKKKTTKNQDGDSSSTRHSGYGNDGQSDSLDDEALYSYEEDSDYGDPSESPSPDYQDQDWYSDDEDDFDYISVVQSPDLQDRYSDEKIRITRGERNELLNELTRERGQRLVESMEIPKDSIIGNGQMKLFKKLAIRGCKPIMSGDWACDFPTLPNALFTRPSDGTDDQDLPFEPQWGSSNYAIKALQEVFAIGGRVRDAEYLTITQHEIIERSIRKYMQRVMYSAGLQTVKSAIPVHTIVSQKAGEDLVATLDRATKLLRGLMWRHMESHEDHTGGSTYWPVLIGFVIAGPILCLLSLDGNPDNEANKKAPEDEPVVRFMTHVDFSHAPFDVWNSLAAVICISHVRDTSLRLAEIWEGFRTVHRFRDKIDETDDEDL